MAAEQPLERIGRPEAVVAAVSFMIPEETSWITGQSLHIDGGLSI